MISEQDLQEAIAECQGKRNPDANTCVKLAAFYTIKNEMYGKPQEIPERGYAYAAPSEYISDTEFGRIIQGKDTNVILGIMDELMTTLNAVYPRLYDSVIRELS